MLKQSFIMVKDSVTSCTQKKLIKHGIFQSFGIIMACKNDKIA